MECPHCNSTKVPVESLSFDGDTYVFCGACKKVIKTVLEEGKLLLKVVSPTGCVHLVNDESHGKYSTECNHKDYFQGWGEGFYHKWDLTEKPVTCKRCLKLLHPSRRSPGDVRGEALEDIRDLAVGYDGFTTIKGLKSLIDVMHNIAVKALNNEPWFTTIPPQKKE